MNSQRNYPLLLVSQFLGAFGDNAILAVILGQLTYLKMAGKITEEELRTSNTLYTSLLFIPYVLLAPIAGFLNDRYSKTRWLAGGNLIKILGTLLCALSISYGQLWQGIGYFVVGIGSCFYGPAKYGILPEILPRERLVKANGTVELLTLVAILGGAIAGSIMADRWKDSVASSYTVLLAIFSSSLLLNWIMERTPERPSTQLASSVSEFTFHFRDLLTAPRLSRILIGTALFWICGATMKINFQPWGLDVLKLPDNTQIALLGLWLSVGVMIGSILAGQLFKVSDLRSVRGFGFALASFLALLFSVAKLDFWRSFVVKVGAFQLIIPVILLLVATGIAAGLFLIPLNAALQSESDPQKLGKTIAVQNLVDNLGMIVAGLICFLSAKANLSASSVFLLLAFVTASAVAWLKIAPPSNRQSQSKA